MTNVATALPVWNSESFLMHFMIHQNVKLTNANIKGRRANNVNLTKNVLKKLPSSLAKEAFSAMKQSTETT